MYSEEKKRINEQFGTKLKKQNQKHVYSVLQFVSDKHG